MKTTLNWKRYQRRLRYWLDHSNRPRLLREEMEFHIESMAQDLRYAFRGMRRNAGFTTFTILIAGLGDIVLQVTCSPPLCDRWTTGKSVINELSHSIRQCHLINPPRNARATASDRECTCNFS
jgi:hypothetical protein